MNTFIFRSMNLLDLVWEVHLCTCEQGAHSRWVMAPYQVACKIFTPNRHHHQSPPPTHTHTPSNACPPTLHRSFATPRLRKALFGFGGLFIVAYAAVLNSVPNDALSQILGPVPPHRSPLQQGPSQPPAVRAVGDHLANGDCGGDGGASNSGSAGNGCWASRALRSVCEWLTSRRGRWALACGYWANAFAAATAVSLGVAQRL